MSVRFGSVGYESVGQRSGYRGAGTGDVELLQVVHCRMLPSGGALGVSVEEAGGDGADRAHDGGCSTPGFAQPGSTPQIHH